jgi:hypothetical protein
MARYSENGLLQNGIIKRAVVDDLKMAGEKASCAMNMMAIEMAGRWHPLRLIRGKVGYIIAITVTHVVERK